MDDNQHIARATALLAGNAYALVKAMDVTGDDASLPRAFLLVTFIPAFGIACAYNMLEPPVRRSEEIASAACIGVMLLLWIAYGWTF